jgi:hypothetical protein
VKWIPPLTNGETGCAPGSQGGMQACDGDHVTPTFYKNKNFVQIGVHIKMHIKL